MANRQTRVKFPVYSGYEVRVILAADIVRTGHRLNADLKGCKAALVTHEGAYHCWIVFAPDPPPEFIAHEAAHAVRALFDFVGAGVDDESFAYHLDFLVGRIHKFLKGRK